MLKTIVILFILPLNLMAKDILATFHIPKLVESPTEGIFVEMANKIIKENNLNVEIKLYPTMRAIQLFKEGKVIGMFPSLKTMMGDFDHNQTKSFYVKKDVIFYNAEKPIKNLEQLKGLKIGITRGYPYGNKLRTRKDFIVEVVKSDEQNIEKLSLKRIDAFICELKSGKHAIKKSGFKNIRFEEENPVNMEPVFFSFSKSKKGKKLRDIFTENLPNLINKI